MSNFILNADHKLKEATLKEWSSFYKDGANRRVAEDRAGKYWVSTVFLGFDHGIGEPGEPLLFETMVFEGAGKCGDEQDIQRYCTWDEASTGHAHMVEKWKKIGNLS